MKNPASKSIIAVSFAVLMAIVLLRTFALSQKDPPGQREEAAKEEAAKTLSSVVTENGEKVIKLSLEAQSRLGLRAAPLEAAREEKEATAPGVVLDVQGLVNLATSYASAQANLHRAENNLTVSQSEYDRLKSLYAKNQNVSQKAFQTGTGMYHNDQNDVQMARQNMDLVTAAVRQSWGNKVGEWVADDPPSLNRILNREDMLVQVTLPPDGPASAPGEVSLELPNQRSVTAKLVSRFPQVDPRIQGPGFLYVTPAQGTLAPGLNVVAHLSYGPRLKGVIVPSSAIIWWQGEPWVYVETASGQFTHKAVQSDHPVAGGFFCATGFKPGEKVVVQGAEQILAIELNPSPQPSSGGEGDDN
jgi:hypothetical protein